MLKSFFKFLLATAIYTFVFMLANAVTPLTQRLREAGASDDPMGLLFILTVAAWVCFTVYFMVRHAQYSGKKLFITIVSILFAVQLFMAQIETLLFGHAFPLLTVLDVMFIMLAGLLPLLAITPLMIKFFQPENAVVEKKSLNVKSMLIKLGIIGVVYFCIYFVFGYFVAWQFEDLRILYSGSPEKLSFWGQMVHNATTNPIIFPFQIVRGVLFGVFVIPLINLFKTKKVFVTSICLIFLYLGIVFITPNPLFPNMARAGHFFEMTGSMLTFGIIVGNILWVKNITINH